MFLSSIALNCMVHIVEMAHGTRPDESVLVSNVPGLDLLPE